jgi:hypothetical protein
MLLFLSNVNNLINSTFYIMFEVGFFQSLIVLTIIDESGVLKWMSTFDYQSPSRYVSSLETAGNRVKRKWCCYSLPTRHT